MVEKKIIKKSFMDTRIVSNGIHVRSDLVKPQTLEYTFLDQENPRIHHENGKVVVDEKSAHFHEYRVYKWRWYVLMVVSLLNCFNTLSWISYAPVANKIDDFYGPDTANYLTIVYLITVVPIGVLGMWLVQKYGVRTAILSASWLNGVGSVIRVISSLEFLVPSEHSQAVVIAGQAIAACAYPFIMCLPTKVVAVWFPHSSRTTANTIANLGNPLGVLMAMLISPNFVFKHEDVLYLNLAISACCIIATFLATVGVRSSQPPTAPSRGAEIESLPFFCGIKKLCKSRSYCILVLALGAGIGMFNALYGLMQQILCARGYSNQFAGYCCVSMIVSGFAGSFMSGVVADRTKKFEEIMKIAFALAVFGGICFSVSALRSNFSAPIVVFCVVFGFFGLASYPLGLEMGVEVSSPVAETTSSGFIALSGQIQGTVFLVGMKLLRSELIGKDVNHETCSADSQVVAYDMTLPLLVFCSVATFICVFFLIAFRPKLKRIQMEQRKDKV